MGTHPIFESDFDCLTEMKLYVAGRVVQRSLATTSNLKYHQIPINFGIVDWWGVAGKVKPKDEIAAYDHTKVADCQYKDQYTVYPKDIQAPAGVESFNVIDGDAPGGTPLGGKVQFESVANSTEIPTWYVNFNAWKFRQDWPVGNASKQGMLADDQNNILEPMLDAMRDRMYDNQRQDVFYRSEVGDYAWTKKDTLPYEEWAPMSADHKYLNATGRQLLAEMDEEWMMDKIVTGHTKVAGGLFAPWTRMRNINTIRKVQEKVNAAVLRSQF